jgi:hypothetical protein
LLAFLAEAAAGKVSRKVTCSPFTVQRHCCIYKRADRGGRDYVQKSVNGANLLLLLVLICATVVLFTQSSKIADSKYSSRSSTYYNIQMISLLRTSPFMIIVM